MRRPESPIAWAVVFFLALPVAAGAREEGEPERSPSSPAAAPPPGDDSKRRLIRAGPGGGSLEISAGPGSILGKDELILREYVDIRIRNVRLQADYVRYVPSTHEAYAEGNVILDQGSSRITAERMIYNLETDTGTFRKARGYAAPNIYFEAEEVEKISATELVLHDATFTSCTQPIPYWSFKVTRGLLRLDDYAYLHNLSFKIGRVSVFYTPYLVWPIKTDRASGLLFPEFGFSNRGGTVLSQAFYWAIRRNMDATFYLDYLSKAGYGTGVEYRYVPSELGRGSLTAYYIRDQVAKQEQREGVPVNRWVVNYGHNQDLASDWRLVANANFISDFNYYLDFERDIRLSTNPQAVSDLFLSRNWGFYSLNLRGERREQLVRDPVTDEEEVIVRWIQPEIEFRSRRQRLGTAPLFLTLKSSVDNFRKGEAGADYQRLDVFPELSSQLSPVPWLDIDASAGVRNTYYTKSQSSLTGEILDEAFNRNFYLGGLKVIGPKVSRVIERPESSFSRQYKHTIEPTFRYTYLSPVEQTDQIIQFDEIDIVSGNANLLTYGLVTRLFAKRPAGRPLYDGGGVGLSGAGRGGADDPFTAQRTRREEEMAAAQAGTGDDSTKGPPLSTVEIATLEISQSYSFLGPLSLSGALNRERQVSPIRSILRINPSIYTGIDIRTSFDVLFREMREASLSANLTSPRRGFLDLTWSMVRDLEGRSLAEQGLLLGEPVDRNQIGLHGETNLLDHRLLLGAQVNYEMGTVAPGEPRLRDQRYRLGYNSQCCGFQFEILNRNFVGSSQREFRFLINLSGIGNVVDLHQRSGGGGGFP